MSNFDERAKLAIDGATHINDGGSDSNLSIFSGERTEYMLVEAADTIGKKMRGSEATNNAWPCQIWKNFLIQRKLYE
jgi:hypothetical protein